jgi:transposase
MKKHAKPDVGVFAGIDVSARQISVARLQRGEENPAFTTFANSASGHTALVAFLLHAGDGLRVCLEASGNYSLDVALMLHAHRQVEVSVINPRRARRFAESLGERSKTDPVDAYVLCQYAARMPWESWQPPSSTALRLRAITRAIESLGVMHTQENNRAHALSSSQALPALVLRERQRHQHYLEHRIKQLRREACRLIARDPELDRYYRLMLTVPGIAQTSALQILGELAVLSETSDARQWVAFSGLDPCHFSSGTSVEKRPRISRGGSRYLRHALYMLSGVIRPFAERTTGQYRMPASVRTRLVTLHCRFIGDPS